MPLPEVVVEWAVVVVAVVVVVVLTVVVFGVVTGVVVGCSLYIQFISQRLLFLKISSVELTIPYDSVFYIQSIFRIYISRATI